MNSYSNGAAGPAAAGHAHDARPTVAVSGATGYAGGEMLRILAGHPELNVVTVAAHSSAGDPLGRHQPHLRRYADMVLAPTTAEALADHDVVVLALPHGASGALAAAIEARNPDALVVDLGADHRLVDPAAWAAYYGGEHPGSYPYALPELVRPVGANFPTGKQRDALPGARRLAVPGCNVTAVTLGLAPLLAAGVVAPTGIAAVLANGPSGAGKSPKTHLLASEILGSATSYGVGGVHRHIPEIEQNLNWALGAEAAGGPVRLSFTPTLVPMARGILATITARPVGADPAAAARAAYAAAYADERFVTVLPEGLWPATAHTLGANSAHVQVAHDERADTLVVSVAIDNLVKGTAGQATQGINLALGLDEGLGLTTEGTAP